MSMTMHKFDVTEKTPNLKENLGQIKSNLNDTKNTIVRTLQDLKGLAQEKLDHSVEDVRVKSVRAKKNVSEYVIKHPIKTFGIALLLGFVTSKWL